MVPVALPLLRLSSALLTSKGFSFNLRVVQPCVFVRLLFEQWPVRARAAPCDPRVHCMAVLAKRSVSDLNLFSCFEDFQTEMVGESSTPGCQAHLQLGVRGCWCWRGAACQQISVGVRARGSRGGLWAPGQAPGRAQWFSDRKAGRSRCGPERPGGRIGRLSEQIRML